MITWIALVAGLFIGAVLGIMVICLLIGGNRVTENDLLSKITALRQQVEERDGEIARITQNRDACAKVFEIDRLHSTGGADGKRWGDCECPSCSLHLCYQQRIASLTAERDALTTDRAILAAKLSEMIVVGSVCLACSLDVKKAYEDLESRMAAMTANMSRSSVDIERENFRLREFADKVEIAYPDFYEHHKAALEGGKEPTMDSTYHDGSNHPVCHKCGFCKICGDCEKYGCGKEKP